jgi:hypothetical protein
MLQDKLEEARQYYEQSLDISKRLGYQYGIATNSHSLGLLAESEGNKAEAANLFRVAMRIYETLGIHKANRTREDLDRVEGASNET